MNKNDDNDMCRTRDFPPSMINPWQLKVLRMNAMADTFILCMVPTQEMLKQMRAVHGYGDVLYLYHPLTLSKDQIQIVMDNLSNSGVQDEADAMHERYGIYQTEQVDEALDDETVISESMDEMNPFDECSRVIVKCDDIFTLNNMPMWLAQIYIERVTAINARIAHQHVNSSFGISDWSKGKLVKFTMLESSPESALDSSDLLMIVEESDSLTVGEKDDSVLH